MRAIELRQQKAEKIARCKEMVERAEGENREFSPQEILEYDGLKGDIDALAKRIARVEEIGDLDEEANRSHKPGIRPDLDGDSSGTPPGDQGFRSFGEQLMAVARAAQPGGSIDNRLTTRAAGMNEAVPAEGGFLVQQDFASELLKRAYQTGVLAQRCRRVPIGPNANGLKVNAIAETSRANGSRWGGVEAFWTGEGDQKTPSKPKFREMDMKLYKLTALCYATDELLEDAVALQAITEQAFAEEIGFKLDTAIVSGNGAGMPIGIMNSPAKIPVPKEAGQPADTVVAQNIMNMRARLWARSRPNSVWYINQDVEPQLHAMSLPVGAGGVPVYLPANGLSGLPYDTLYGRPIIPIEQCETLGDEGDVILADLGEYLMIDKGPLQSALSIHVRFIYDESTFRFVYRANGQPIWDAPLTPFKGTKTQSPFITLAVRA